MKLIAIMLTTIFTQNFVLSKFLGICPFLGVSKKKDTAIGMSAAVIFVMLLATIVCYPLNVLLEKNGFEYLQTLVFILVIAALVQFVEITLKKYMKSLYSSLGIFLPLITTNCAVLGLVTLNVQESYNFIESIFNALGAGLGFMLAMIMFSGIRERMEGNDVPKFWQGLPITLVAAALVTCTFLGFTGIIENMFGA
ncbi:MAG: RnfABCDGE type electron transport complex subunit A [Clostridia bacterium]|nr:RnfABCDGE type electron transport complex subunit A [Clostridia bacterium]MBQ5480361.1 RnfABCDGE type electron transport complex subunit A [Clostridia bacterium]